VQDSDSIIDPNQVGAIARLVEFPVFSQFGGTGPDAVFDNPLYDAAQLLDDRNPDGSAITGSPLANLFHEQVAFTCADCHLGSAGANNRYGDFRSSGCTSCHMRYSLDGRSTSGDPNVPKTEPLNPDQIDDPERPHIRRHLVQSVAKTLPGGEFVQGIDDYTCAGCHQGSNRTVLQFWGIRLDQNADLEHGLQYPANPVSFVDTRDDTRLYDPVVDNNTFNGRKHDQYILFEDYDGDGRDDTPPDVHYEAGLGCIDCHGSNDLHGTGLVDGGTSLVSRMEQAGRDPLRELPRRRRCLRGDQVGYRVRRHGRRPRSRPQRQRAQSRDQGGERALLAHEQSSPEFATTFRRLATPS
jgi:hypothetical protein